jgi:hypothetical protein
MPTAAKEGNKQVTRVTKGERNSEPAKLSETRMKPIDGRQTLKRRREHATPYPRDHPRGCHCGGTDRSYARSPRAQRPTTLRPMTGGGAL